MTFHKKLFIYFRDKNSYSSNCCVFFLNSSSSESDLKTLVLDLILAVMKLSKMVSDWLRTGTGNIVTPGRMRGIYLKQSLFGHRTMQCTRVMLWIEDVDEWMKLVWYLWHPSSGVFSPSALIKTGGQRINLTNVSEAASTPTSEI